jgi:hypothetical protein
MCPADRALEFGFSVTILEVLQRALVIELDNETPPSLRMIKCSALARVYWSGITASPSIAVPGAAA